MKISKSMDRWLKGLTLVECIVVISIIGLLMALVIPAVLSSREAMRRARCANNLHQIGVWLNSYLTQFSTLPAGSGMGGTSFHTALLPNLEEGSLYNSINFSTKIPACLAPDNRTAKSSSIATFVCPSDGVSNVPIISNNSYAGNEGVLFDPETKLHSDDGVFTTNQNISEASLTDGMSATTAVSEWSRSVTTRRVRLGRKVKVDVNYVHDHCLVAIPGPRDRTKDANWFIGAFGYTTYNHVMAINQNSCDVTGGLARGAWTAGSQHPSGANVLFADGHTSFVKQTIELPTWRALGTRAGGEITSAL